MKEAMPQSLDGIQALAFYTLKDFMSLLKKTHLTESLKHEKHSVYISHFGVTMTEM
jgi:hypothetical protein